MTLTQVRVNWLSSEWRDAVATDAGVQTTHLMAPEIVEDSLLVLEADAQAEATRRQTLRGTQRDRFEVVIQMNDNTEDKDLGDVITLTHSRYGLDAGKQFVVLGIRPDAARNRITLDVWG